MMTNEQTVPELRLRRMVTNDQMYRRFKYSRLYRLLGGAWGFDD